MAALLAAVVVPASPQGAFHFLIFFANFFELTLCQPVRKVRCISYFLLGGRVNMAAVVDIVAASP